MFGLHRTIPSTDTSTVPKILPATPKNLLMNSMNDVHEVSYAYTFDHDEAPDSPRTLLGEEVDPDEICSPLSSNGSNGCFIAETPPRSPSTLLGDSNDLDEINSPSSSGTSSRNWDAEDEPGSPSTILGDYTDINEAQIHRAKASSKDIFTNNFDHEDHPHSPSTIFGNEVDLEEVNTVSLNLGLPSPDNYHDESGDDDDFINFLQSVASQDKSPQASRCYVQQPNFIWDAVRRIDGWPDSITKAFMVGDWNLGINEEGRTVLEVISGRKDLEKWFTDMANNRDLPDM